MSRCDALDNLPTEQRVLLNYFSKVLKSLIPAGFFFLSSGSFLLAQNAQVQWKENAVGFNEAAGTVQVTLTRTGNLGSLATVFYRTVEGTATSGFDYLALLNRQALFTAGTEEITIHVSITQDFIEEGSETFLLQLFNPNTGTVIGSQKDLTVTILDDDQPSVQWSNAIVRIAEDTTEANLSLTRTGGIGSSFSVKYQTSAVSATPLQDYQSASGIINFPAGVSEQTVLININNDTFTESDEEFIVTLSDPSSGNIGPQNPVRVIIEDDESAPGTIGWNVGSVQEIEGNKQIQVVAQRIGGKQGSVSVNYMTIGATATGGSDYQPTNGILTWSSGSNTPRTVTIDLLDDVLDESDETFELVLSNLMGNATLGLATATITIVDNDDVNEAGKISFTGESASVEESVGFISVGVSRVGGTSGELEVSYNFVNEAATNNEDYTGVPGVLSWSSGNGDEQFIQIPIEDDASHESNEIFYVTLAADDLDLLGSVTTFTVQIQDNDINDPGTIVFSNSTQTVSENASVVSIAVQRIGGTTGAVAAVFETQDGSALASADYASQTGMLNWADGDNADKEIMVNLLDDDLYEGSETFSIRLSDSEGGVVVGPNNVHSITVLENESEPSTWFEFTRILYSGTEGSTRVSIQVERFGDGVGSASVRVRSENNTAIAGSDYSVLDSELAWNDGDLDPKVVSLTVIDDLTEEPDERVNLFLAEPSENTLVGDVSTAQALIYDDDRQTGELGNLSTRGYVGSGDNVLIGGFIIRNGSQRILIRGIGPSLQGVEGVVADPMLQIIDNSNQSLVYENNNWTDDLSQIEPIIATGLGQMNGFESALLVTLPEGSYSAVVSPNGQPGIGSIEIYVVTSAGLPGKLLNISTRAYVGSGSQILIGGLIISGNESKKLLFRGMGPSLIIPGSPSMTNPELLLYNDQGQVIHTNKDWLNAANWDEIEATQLIPMDNEAALLLNVAPGAYTIHLRSENGESGVGLVEIYALD